MKFFRSEGSRLRSCCFAISLQLLVRLFSYAKIVPEFLSPIMLDNSFVKSELVLSASMASTNKSQLSTITLCNASQSPVTCLIVSSLFQNLNFVTLSLQLTENFAGLCVSTQSCRVEFDFKNKKLLKLSKSLQFNCAN